MATSNLRKLLDLKMWQAISPSSVTNAATHVVAESSGPDQTAYYVGASTQVLYYDPNEDAWATLPSPALGSFAAGATAKWHWSGPTGTAAAGSTSTTLNTTLTILGNLTARNGLNFRVRITGGTGAGQERLIDSATLGANSVITVTSAWSVTPDNTSTFALYTGRLWIMGGGTLAAGSLKYWDYATATWSGNLSITGLPASFGTEGVLVAPHSISGPTFTGTATSGSATTLVNSAKTWTVNQFSNWQVRIVAGTGAGGIRAITSNTATTLTIASGTAIDNTSQYVIEPSDDFLYLLGNAAVTLYRYSISGNSWSTRSPTAARSGAPGAALSGIWVTGSTAPNWSSESTAINGNRIYSFRGGAGSVLDYYDIGLNTWVSNVTYGRQFHTFDSGSSYVYDGGNYIYIQQNQLSGAPTRWFRFDVRGPMLEPWSVNVFPAPAAATQGPKAWTAVYYDGSGASLRFIYMLQPASTIAQRCLVW